METIPTEDEIEKCKSALKEKEQKLAGMEKELETLRSTSCTCATSQPGKECLKLLFLSKALTFYLSWNQI